MGGLQDGAMTATVFFTDLVGSTAMRSRLGDVRADELRQEHDALITTAVLKHNGTVVKGLGDGIMAAFPAPSQAISAAMTIQKQLADRNRSARPDEQIGVRMGLSIGEVQVEGDDMFGTPVVESARLCNAADGGEIFASDLVLRLAGSRTTVPIVDRGPLELKGLAEPLPTVEILWEHASDLERVPLPSPPGLQVDLPFAGRRFELMAIGSAWRTAFAGDRRVVVVTGEAGTGKTRLLAEFAAKAHNEGGVVLYGRCEELVGYAYQPFAEAFRQYLGDRNDRELAERVGGFGAALDTLVPEMHLATRLGLDELEPLPPELAQRRFRRAVVGWLRAACVDTPILLVLDGLQWATTPTIELLREVLALDARQLTVFVSYRSSEVRQGHPVSELLGELRRDRGIERVDLGPLPPEDLAELADRATGARLGELGTWLGRSLAHLGVVLPWTATESYRAMIASGVLRLVEPAPDGPQIDPHWAVGVESAGELGALATPAATAAHLVDALSPPTREALRLAAVLGAEFDARVLRELPGLSDELAATAIAEAVRGRVIVASDRRFPRYAFVNPALRSLLYDEVPTERRAALHARAVGVLDAGTGRRSRRELAELARHAAIAVAAGGTDVQPERAVALAEAAGRRALEQYAAADAVTWFRRGLDLGTRLGVLNDPRRVELLLELGAAARLAHDSSARATLLEAGTLAARLGADEQLAEAALAVVRPPSDEAWSDDPEVRGLLRAAVDAALSAPPATRARLLAALAAESVWDPEGGRRFAVADEALGIARAGGEPAVLADVLLHRSVAVSSPDTLGERAELAHELDLLAATLGDDRIVVWSALHLWRVACESGDAERADAAIERATTRAAELRIPQLAWASALDRAAHELVRGDLARAEHEARAALAAGTRLGHPGASAWFASQLLAVRRAQGRSVDALAGISTVTPAGAPGPGDPGLVALAWWEAGRADEAWHWYQQAFESGFSLGRTPRLGAELASLAELACRFGHRDGAELLVDRLVSHADAFPCGAVVRPPGAHALGLLSGVLGELDEARAWMARALDREERAEAPLLGIETRIAWAGLGRGDEGAGRERAREMAQEAAEDARRLGATGFEASARALVTQLA
jgi:class 3 adenylate cyclase